MSTGVGTGSTITFQSTSFQGIITDHNLDGEEVTVIDVSGMSTTGYREKKFGVLIEPPELTVDLVHDDDNNPPTPGVTDTCTVTFPGGGTVVGSGAFIGRAISTELEGDRKASYRWKFDGITGPTYTAGSA